MALSKEEKEKRKEQRRKEKYENTHRIIDGVDHKICSICNKWFPSNTENFHINKKNGIDGLYPYCKTCHLKKSMEWQENNKDKLAVSRHKYAMKPKRRQQVREYGQKRRKNGEYQKWQQSNPDRIHRYNIKRQHKNHDITDNEWESCLNYFNHECAYCGFKLDEHIKLYGQQLHKEHVDHEGANDLSNCVPACRICNSSKHTYSLDEWYNDKNKNYTYDMYIKILNWINGDYLHYQENDY